MLPMALCFWITISRLTAELFMQPVPPFLLAMYSIPKSPPTLLLISHVCGLCPLQFLSTCLLFPSLTANNFLLQIRLYQLDGVGAARNSSVTATTSCRSIVCSVWWQNFVMAEAFTWMDGRIPLTAILWATIGAMLMKLSLPFIISTMARLDGTFIKMWERIVPFLGAILWQVTAQFFMLRATLFADSILFSRVLFW